MALRSPRALEGELGGAKQTTPLTPRRGADRSRIRRYGRGRSTLPGETFDDRDRLPLAEPAGRAGPRPLDRGGGEGAVRAVREDHRRPLRRRRLGHVPPDGRLRAAALERARPEAPRAVRGR